MPIDRQQLKAIVFDYGNTLIEFTAKQVGALDRAIAQVLRDSLGPFDAQRYQAIRRESYRAPYSHPELRESTMPDLLGQLVLGLYDRGPTAAELDTLLAVHDEHFVSLIDAPDYLHGLLDRLGERYKLALISNYPCGRSIRGSLGRLGLTRHFQSVVVSGDLGYVKPHGLLFQTSLNELGIAPQHAVYIGDNWLGDVQGAKRIGMWAVHTLQFDTLEVFDREADHHDADLVIQHLSELEKHL